jgi:hypothetical protein
MPADPDFLARCQAWTALAALVPEAHKDAAAELATELDGHYWSLISDYQQAMLKKMRECEQREEQIGLLRQQVDSLNRLIRDVFPDVQEDRPLAPVTTTTH